MSILLSPVKFGNLELRNRFVHSGTYECMATRDGRVTEQLIHRYRKLARGEVGLIIPGYLFVHPLGKGMNFETGIHSDDMIPGLRALTAAVHAEGGRICLQLGHAGRQTKKACIGETPIAPSRGIRDPIYLVKPRRMTEEDIAVAIDAHREGARRAVEAGTDAVHIASGGGYLISQFLSPFFNRRTDGWGGSTEKQFRFLKEIVTEVQSVLPSGMPLCVKLNAHDHTPLKGITPDLAITYAQWLSELGVEGVEIASGTTVWSNLNIWRGGVPVSSFVKTVPRWQKPLAWALLKTMDGRYDLEEAYNLEHAKAIKPHLRGTQLFLVGGHRNFEHMEQVVEQGHADFIAMSRPFIRQPMLVKNFRLGRTRVACNSCNMCVVAVSQDLPLRCYVNGIPEQSE